MAACLFDAEEQGSLNGVQLRRMLAAFYKYAPSSERVWDKQLNCVSESVVIGVTGQAVPIYHGRPAITAVAAPIIQPAPAAPSVLLRPQKSSRTANPAPADDDPLQVLLKKGETLLHAMDGAMGPALPLVSDSVELDSRGELLGEMLQARGTAHAAPLHQHTLVDGGRDLFSSALAPAISEALCRIQSATVRINKLRLLEQVIPGFGGQPCFTVEYSLPVSVRHGFDSSVGNAEKKVRSSKLNNLHEVLFNDWVTYPINFTSDMQDMWSRGSVTFNFYTSGVGRPPLLFGA